MPDSSPRHHRHRHGGHTHGVMSGWVVPPYDWVVAGLLMRGTYRRLAEQVTTGIGVGGRVLDVGTGPGRLVEAMARRRPDLTVIGIDPSADMIARASRRTAALANAQARVAAAEDLPFEDWSFAAVVSSLSSHHWAEPAAALDEQARVLAPGGRLWLVDLISHLSDDIESQVQATGLWFDENAGLPGVAGRRFRVITAEKPLEAA